MLKILNYIDMDLEKLFYPDSLAIVGASDREGKLGYNVLRNLIEHGFEGEIYPVNPKYDTIQGIKAFENVGEIEGEVDAAVSIVPAKITPQAVEDCFEKGIDFVSVQSAGFGERGSKGKEIERELEQLVEDYDSHILGPNCTGVINVNNGMCQSIGRVGELNPGNVGLIAQAGVYAAGILWGLRKIMDFSIIATIGNKLDIDETHVMKYMGEEETIDVIALYVEDVERGMDFLRTAKEIVPHKPIIVLKGGRTEEGKETATTHTASIGGSREVYDTLFREGGICPAEDNEHMFDLVRAFSKQPLPSTDKFMVITYSGSQGITATDTLIEHGLGLADLSEETEKEIKRIIPEVIEGTNPADLTFDQSPEQVEKIIETAAEDEEVGGFVANLQPEILKSYVDNFEKIDSKGKPVYVSVTGKEFAMDEVIEMEKIGYPVFATPERAAQIASETFTYKIQGTGVSPPEEFEVNEDKVERIIDEALRDNRRTIGGIRALELFEAYGVPTADHYLAKSREEASEIFKQIEGPVAMKIESKEILHKTDVGGVLLNVEEDADSAFDKIMKKVLPETGLEKEQIEGVCIQPMLTEGKETLIGAHYEEILNGHIMRFGLGGQYTEIFKDTSARTVPLTSEKAEAMIEETDYIGKLLKGPRGEKPCDESIIIETLLRISQLVDDFPNISEIETNPFLVWSDGAAVIDARLKIGYE